MTEKQCTKRVYVSFVIFLIIEVLCVWFGEGNFFNYEISLSILFFGLLFCLAYLIYFLKLTTKPLDD